MLLCFDNPMTVLLPQVKDWTSYLVNLVLGLWNWFEEAQTFRIEANF